jgi:hypothetical protein
VLEWIYGLYSDDPISARIVKKVGVVGFAISWYGYTRDGGGSVHLGLTQASVETVVTAAAAAFFGWIGTNVGVLSVHGPGRAPGRVRLQRAWSELRSGEALGQRGVVSAVVSPVSGLMLAGCNPCGAGTAWQIGRACMMRCCKVLDSACSRV